MGAILVTVMSAALAAGAGSEIDLGAVDQKPPKKDELVAPKKDDGVGRVDLRGTVKGKAAVGEKRNLYVVITPVSNPDLAGTWWVQQEVTREGEMFTAEAQFGEEDAGSGEYFAVLAVATDKKWSVGEKLTGLPEGAACTKLKIVRRK
jgi:hypothetical protein